MKLSDANRKGVYINGDLTPLRAMMTRRWLTIFITSSYVSAYLSQLQDNEWKTLPHLVGAVCGANTPELVKHPMVGSIELLQMLPLAVYHVEWFSENYIMFYCLKLIDNQTGIT